MRDYGIVSPKFWTGDTGKALRGNPEAQVLATYLMTSPHSSMTGVFYCPVMYMGHETGLGIEGASKALARLIEVGFCEYDEASETVFVLRMAAFQIGDSLSPRDNRVVGLRKELAKMPNRIRARFLNLYGVAFSLIDDSDSEAPLKPLRSQEQEQEQEQEKPLRRAKSIKSSIPDDFSISDRVRTWATSKGYARLDEHFDAFVSKARAKDYRYVDWDEAFMGAIRSDWANLNAKQNSTVDHGESPAARRKL